MDTDRMQIFKKMVSTHLCCHPGYKELLVGRVAVIACCVVLVVWKPNELRQALMPTLEKLYRLEPESLPFRQAVDPVLLQIPVS